MASVCFEVHVQQATQESNAATPSLLDARIENIIWSSKTDLTLLEIFLLAYCHELCDTINRTFISDLRTYIYGKQAIGLAWHKDWKRGKQPSSVCRC